MGAVVPLLLKVAATVAQNAAVPVLEWLLSQCHTLILRHEEREALKRSQKQKKAPSPEG